MDRKSKGKIGLEMNELKFFFMYRYDCILDLAGGWDKSGKFIQYGRRSHCKFILLNFHGIHNLDNYGLIFGGLKTGWDLASLNVNSKLRHGVDIKWGIFDPNLVGFKEIVDLVKQRKVGIKTVFYPTIQIRKN